MVGELVFRLRYEGVFRTRRFGLFLGTTATHANADQYRPQTTYELLNL